MANEFVIKNGLIINETHSITGITNNSGLTYNTKRIVTEDAIKKYIDFETYSKVESDAKFVYVTGDTMTGPLTINDSTSSTSTSTGALIVSGGIGVGENVSVGERLQVNWSGGYNSPNPFSTNPRVYIEDNYNGIAGATMKNTSTGNNADFRFILFDTTEDAYLAFHMPGDNNTQTLWGETRSDISGMFLNRGRKLAIGTVHSADFILGTDNSTRMVIEGGGNVNILSTTNSTSPTTGGLVVSGGAGFNNNISIGENINLGQKINFSSFNNTTTTDGDLWYDGSILYFRSGSTDINLLQDLSGSTINSLEDIGDVIFTNLQSGDTLIYNNGLWINSASTSTNNYLIGINGNGNSSGVTFSRQGLSSIIWDASHNHDDLYYSTGNTYTKTEVDNLIYTGDTFDSSLYYTKIQSDERYVDITGDTMTGDLFLPTLSASTSINISGATIYKNNNDLFFENNTGNYTFYNVTNPNSKTILTLEGNGNGGARFILSDGSFAGQEMLFDVTNGEFDWYLDGNGATTNDNFNIRSYNGIQHNWFKSGITNTETFIKYDSTNDILDIDAHKGSISGNTFYGGFLKLESGTTIFDINTNSSFTNANDDQIVTKLAIKNYIESNNIEILEPSGGWDLPALEAYAERQFTKGQPIWLHDPDGTNDFNFTGLTYTGNEKYNMLPWFGIGGENDDFSDSPVVRISGTLQNHSGIYGIGIKVSEGQTLTVQGYAHHTHYQFSEIDLDDNATNLNTLIVDRAFIECGRVRGFFSGTQWGVVNIKERSRLTCEYVQDVIVNIEGGGKLDCGRAFSDGCIRVGYDGTTTSTSPAFLTLQTSTGCAIRIFSDLSIVNVSNSNNIYLSGCTDAVIIGAGNTYIESGSRIVDNIIIEKNTPKDDNLVDSGLTYWNQNNNRIENSTGFTLVDDTLIGNSFRFNPYNNTPLDGDLWYDGSILYFRSGSTNINLLQDLTGSTLDGYTKSEADAKFVYTSGDTMIGDLNIQTNLYVSGNTNIYSNLTLASGTSIYNISTDSGFTNINNDSIATTQAIKNYVDTTNITYELYLSSTTQSIANSPSYSTIIFDQERYSPNSEFYIRTGSTIGGYTGIKINKDGKYKIEYSISIDNNSNSRTNSKSRLILNNVEISGSLSFTYHRNSSQGLDTHMKSLTLNLSVGDIIEIQANRINGSGSLTLIENGSNLLITKVN